MGALKVLTDMGLFIGQSEEFFELLRDSGRCRRGQTRVSLRWFVVILWKAPLRNRGACFILGCQMRYRMFP